MAHQLFFEVDVLLGNHGYSVPTPPRICLLGLGSTEVLVHRVSAYVYTGTFLLTCWLGRN